jgi:signal transduction histidine kinase
MPIDFGIRSSPGAPLARRIAWLTAARLLFLVLLLGLVGLFGRERTLAVESFTVQVALMTLGVAFALAGVYAAVLRSGRHLEQLADFQLVFDQLTWTVIVYLSGGPSSGATSLYGLSCIAGAALTGLRGAGLAALAAGLSYGALTLLLHSGWLLPPPDQPGSLYALDSTELAYHVLINLLGLVVVTLLSGYLAERLRRTGGQLVVAEQRAQQAERLAALGRLATGLAHEIRNPLGSIAGSVQMLKASDRLTDEDRQLCEIVEREAARLDDLVTDMMDLTRPRDRDVVHVDVARVAQEVVELARRSGRGKSDVRVDYLGVEAATVEADAAQLRQLIWNLVRNAVQASKAGDAVRVDVSVEHGRVELRVEDDGVGIDEESKERLFDAFFTNRSQGTGVGLAVVKRIADEHGFTLSVDSKAGQGAAFHVALGPNLASGPERDRQAQP